MKKEKAPRQYFMPGEAILQIRHPALGSKTDTEEKIVVGLREFLASGTNQYKYVASSRPLSNLSWKERLKIPDVNQKVITIPSKNKNNEIFSLVSVRLPEHDDEDLSQDDVSDVLAESEKDLKHDSILIGNNLALESISPNWLANSLHHGATTGGPGGWPYKASAPSGDQWQFEVHGPLNSLDPYRKQLAGTDFHVAILDTAPSRHDMDRAYHERPNHPLVQALFGPNSNFDVTYANRATMSQLMHFSPDSHAYWMADHGTFIAGIVYTLAPAAKLHLYEVLSPYGVGSFKSVAEGMEKAITDRGTANYPLIINCSWMFSLPVRGVNDLDRPMLLQAEPNSSLTKSMRELFNWITDETTNVILVAAAGNDANNNSAAGNRPDARFPASFDNVVGVGGLPKDFRREDDDPGKYKPATYSNLSDAPPRTGFMTLGGETEPDEGVLGVFISPFPDHNPDASAPEEVSYNPNPTGWARWAGTSFAAPIISGLLANFPSIPATEATGGTRANEKVIVVYQKIDLAS